MLACAQAWTDRECWHWQREMEMDGGLIVPGGPQEIQGAELSGLRQLQVHLRAPSPEA